VTLGKISSEGLRLVLPLHPRTRKLYDPSRFSDTKMKIIEPVSYLDKIIESAKTDRRPSTQYPVYGDGKAGEKIVDILRRPGCYREIKNAAPERKLKNPER